MRRALLFSLSLLFAAALEGATISSVSPAKFWLYEGESFLTIDGNGFSAESKVTMSGPAGTFTIAPNAWSSGRLTVWVPLGILYVEGRYAVTVDGSNARYFDVINMSDPVLYLPLNPIHAEATSRAGAVVEYSVRAASTQDGHAVPIACTPASGSTFPFGTTMVQCTATDDETGSTSHGMFSVIVADTTPPSMVMPRDIVREADRPHDTAIVHYSVSAHDNVDGELVPGCDTPSGAVFMTGITLVTCVATDAHANATSGTFRVTILPRSESAPVLHLPDDIVTTERVVTYVATATDDIDGDLPVTCQPPSGSEFPVGTTVVQCSATDSSGNTGTGTFTVTVERADTTPPMLMLPDDIVTTERVVTFTATAIDDMDGSVPVTCTPASGSDFPIGTSAVQCSASDRSGNTANGTFTVTVERADTTPPLLMLPDDITSTERVVTYVATATDDVDGSVAVMCTPPSGSEFPIGTSTVQCSASDASGNTTTGSFTVTVTEADITPPVLTLPAIITIEADGPGGAHVTFTASAHDDRDSDVPVSCSPASGALFPLGTMAVNCTASDAAGNGVTGTFTVTVADTTPPGIVRISATPSVLWPANHELIEIRVTADAVDRVDPAPRARVYAVTANEAVDAPGSGNTAYDWNIVEPLKVELRAERSGESRGRIYTIYVECVDASGNPAVGTVEVLVPHEQPRDGSGSRTPKRRRSVRR